MGVDGDVDGVSESGESADDEDAEDEEDEEDEEVDEAYEGTYADVELHEGKIRRAGFRKVLNVEPREVYPSSYNLQYGTLSLRR